MMTRMDQRHEEMMARFDERHGETLARLDRILEKLTDRLN
jgi:hypothetical protein